MPGPAGVLFETRCSWAHHGLCTTGRALPQGLHSPAFMRVTDICGTATQTHTQYQHEPVIPNTARMPAPSSLQLCAHFQCWRSRKRGWRERTKTQPCSGALGSSQKPWPLQSGILAMDAGSSSLKFSSLCAWPHAATSGIFCQNSSFVSHNN